MSTIGNIKWGLKESDEFISRIDIWNLSQYIKKNKDYQHIKMINIQAEELTDTPSAPNFNNYDIPGRSSPPATYSSSDARTVSFSLSLNRDLCSGKNEEEVSKLWYKILDEFKALNYPIYSKNGVVAPSCYCIISRDCSHSEKNGSISIRGYATTTVTYRLPMDKFGRYMNADVSIDITEVAQTSFDGTEIRKGGYVTRKSTKHKSVR